MDEALVDYLLPQFDGLDLDILRKIKESISLYFNISETEKTKNFQEKINKMYNNLTVISQLFESSK